MNSASPLTQAFLFSRTNKLMAGGGVPLSFTRTGGFYVPVKGVADLMALNIVKLISS